MKVSVIVATRNRAYAIAGCLDSIGAAIAHAAPLDAEIVVVDNGSTDGTEAAIKSWTSANAVPVQMLSEPTAGLSRAHNRALRAAQGDLLVFTDDDCRLSKAYITDLLRYDAADTDLVLRGGRIELGDPTDLPLTINTSPTRSRWNRSLNSARHECLSGQINGCNMAMRRAVIELVGFFDERWGPGASGASMPSGGDTDYLFRAYLAGIWLEYVPDMTVIHNHGRKTHAAGFALMRTYMIANGALCAKYFFRHPNLCRPFYWDAKNAIREILSGTNTFLPSIGFSNKDKVAYRLRGVAEYLFMGKGRSNTLAPFNSQPIARTWTTGKPSSAVP
jgi:GT2 family glycosyltransferase